MERHTGLDQTHNLQMVCDEFDFFFGYTESYAKEPRLLMQTMMPIALVMSFLGSRAAAPVLDVMRSWKYSEENTETTEFTYD